MYAKTCPFIPLPPAFLRALEPQLNYRLLHCERLTLWLVRFTANLGALSRFSTFQFISFALAFPSRGFAECTALCKW